jgi:flagellar basal-body rod protein FlgF
MDRMIYVAMTGAEHILNQQAVVAHNLANVATTGYRADTSVFREVAARGEGLATRSFVVDSTAGADFTPGPINPTGRDLDVAVQGQGWIAVQAEDGGEAYTRNGAFQISPNGVLQTASGLNVAGDGGPIAIPADTAVTIATDGTVSGVPVGTRPGSVVTLGRIKLVNPAENLLSKGADGLFRLAGGASAEADGKVVVAPGALEGSNVNAVETMVSMITLARQFDMQMKLLQTADKDSQQASQLLSISR